MPSKALFTLGKFKAVSTTAVGKQAVGAAAAGAESMFGMVIFGGFGVLSAITNQIEYMHERADIANFYREELSAQHKKPQNQLTDADLTAAENGDPAHGITVNKTIKQAVAKERGFRNLGIASSFIASVAVFTLLEAVVAHSATFQLGLFLAKAAVGVLTYMAIKEPLMRVGTKVFGLDKETTHDKIEELAKDRAKGMAVTREQVVEIFISANDELANYVERSFGQSYEELRLADKVRVADELAKHIPVDKIVHNINLGTTNASELAFTVEGQFSGVLPKGPEMQKPASAFQQFASTCKHMLHSVTGLFGAEKAKNIEHVNKLEKAHAMTPVSERGDESPIVEMNTPTFAERVGRTSAQHKPYVQQLAERSQQVTMPGSNTLQ